MRIALIIGEMKNKVLSIVVLVCLGVGCKDKAEERDGSGMFEAREVIVSSEISGRIERLDVMEGDYIEAGKVVGLIDTMQLHWLKVQAQQAVKAVDERIPDLDKVLEVYRLKLTKGEKELKRVERLLQGKAATQKQYDDVKAMVGGCWMREIRGLRRTGPREEAGASGRKSALRTAGMTGRT